MPLKALFLVILVSVERCKITVILFGSMLPNLKDARVAETAICMTHPFSHEYVRCSKRIPDLFLFIIIYYGIGQNYHFK